MNAMNTMNQRQYAKLTFTVTTISTNKLDHFYVTSVIMI